MPSAASKESSCASATRKSKSRAPASDASWRSANRSSKASTCRSSGRRHDCRHPSLPALLVSEICFYREYLKRPAGFTDTWGRRGAVRKLRTSRLAGGGAIPLSDNRRELCTTESTRDCRRSRRCAAARCRASYGSVACRTDDAPAGGRRLPSLRAASFAADEVKPQVERFLAGGQEPFELIVDAGTNRLLVGGSIGTQALVAQLLATLDRPPVAAAPVAAPAAAPAQRVAAYFAPGFSADTLSAELTRRYGAAGARPSPPMLVRGK